MIIIKIQCKPLNDNTNDNDSHLEQQGYASATPPTWYIYSTLIHFVPNTIVNQYMIINHHLCGTLRVLYEPHY
jgi:hypothetical protein